MKKEKIKNFDLKIILGSLVMVVALFAMAFFCFPKNENKIDGNLETVKASSGFTNVYTMGDNFTGLAGASIYQVTSNVSTNYRVELYGTVVIWIAPGCTFTANQGIHLEETDVLILIGEGTLNAYGIKATDGADGKPGDDGYVGDKDESMWGGDGGNGGKGGRGAYAGIGGDGGAGGSAGFRTSTPVMTVENVSHQEKAPTNGGNGGDGSVGGTMGTLYILGNVTVNATAGAKASNWGVASAGQSGKTVQNRTSGGFLWADKFYHQADGGSAGWSGFGGGASAAIGGGGGGGGGGGAGGGGGCCTDTNGYVSMGTGERGDLGKKAGQGGKGTLYSETYKSYSGRYRDYSTDGKLSAINYSINLDNQGATSAGSTSASVYFNKTIPSITRPSRTGYTFNGYYTGTNGSGTIYYDSNGNPLVTYKNFSDMTLYAYWTPTPYNVYFNANGGNSVSTIPYTIEESVYLPSTTRTGYTFNKWYVSSSSGNWSYGAEYSVGTYSKKYGSPTLTAKWNANSYNIILDQQGGSGGSTGTSVNYDSQIPSTISSLPSRTGYAFNGYYTDTGGKGTKYYDSSGSRVYTAVWKNLTGITLYAYWTPVDYTITFDVNGGNYLSSMSYNIESTITLPLPTKKGHSFDNNKDSTGGWLVSSTSVKSSWSNSRYAAGATLSNQYGNVTLKVANWIVNNYTLSFNAMGGSFANSNDASRTITFGQRFDKIAGSAISTPLPIPTKPGCVFKGWYTSSSGGSPVTAATTMSEEGMTVYAQWEETWAVKTTVTEFRVDDSTKTKGTFENPYLISNAEELALIAQKVQTGDTFDSKYFKQTANIDLRKDKNNNAVSYNWLPIGNDTKAFGGHYDGQGFLIENLNTSTTTNASTGQLRDCQGLFGVATNAEIKNINLLSGTVYGKDYTGAIVGYMNGGSITNCRNGVNVNGSENCGLIGGGNCVKITACYNYGNITGVKKIGGIVGLAQSTDNTSKTTIENCYSKCVITASGSNAGGIAGYTTSYTRVSACGFNGNVTGSNKASIVGYSNSSNGRIENCFAIITGSSDLGWYNGSLSIDSCISKFSNGSGKKYTASSNDAFNKWSILENGTVLSNGQKDGQPLPAGFSWLGQGGTKINETIITKLGYNK